MSNSTRISYNPASNLGGSYVASAMRNLVAASNQLQLAVRVLAAVTANGTQPENLEGSAEFDVATGKAQEFQDAVSALATQAKTITDQAFIPQLWQG